MEEPIDIKIEPESNIQAKPKKKELRVRYIFILGISLIFLGLILFALLNNPNEKNFTSSTANEQIIITLISSGILALVAGTIKFITKRRTD